MSYLVVKFDFVDLVMLDDMVAQRCRDPPVHAFGEIGTKIAAIDQRDLNIVDLFRLLDQVFHRRARNVGIVVFQERLDDVDIPGADQRFGDSLGNGFAHGDRELMAERPVFDDLDQLNVL